MQSSMLGLPNIAQKPQQLYTAKAGGLLIVSPQSFAHFMADREYEKYLHMAITAGIAAAKKTSEVFTLCYPIMLQGIDIVVQPTDSIHTDTLQFHTNFIPSFKPKSYKAMRTQAKQLRKQSTNANNESQDQPNMHLHFKRAKEQFHQSQSALHDAMPSLTPPNEHDHCGFEVIACVQARAPMPPNMECMHALHTTLLSLFGIFCHDKSARITQLQLLSD